MYQFKNQKRTIIPTLQYFKRYIYKKHWTDRIAQVVKDLPSKDKALNSNPSTAIKKKNLTLHKSTN
jgi:hypothetical protein